MRLPFDADQATYDEWFEFHSSRVDEKEFYFVDLNDAVMVWAAARSLAAAHPDKLELFIEHGPQAVEDAMDELGMFMGISSLCKKVGLEPEEGTKAMMNLFKKERNGDT